jgi:hypothetical protein
MKNAMVETAGLYSAKAMRRFVQAVFEALGMRPADAELSTSTMGPVSKFVLRRLAISLAPCGWSR